jgi:hypothetical protein
VATKEKFKGMVAKPGKKPACFLLGLFLDHKDGNDMFI